MVSIFTTETPGGFVADLPVTLGTSFTISADDYVASGARYYKYNNAYDGTAINVALYNGNTGTAVATGSRLQTSADPIGWVTVNFGTTVPMSSTVAYIIAYYTPGLGFARTEIALSNALNRAPFHTPIRAGRYIYGSNIAYPDGTTNDNYFADIIARSTSVTATATVATGTAKAWVPTVTRGVVDTPPAAATALVVEPVVTASRSITGGGPATATIVVRPPTARERATVHYVTDDGSPATLLGWWDGFTIQPLAGWGWWTGSDVRTVD